MWEEGSAAKETASDQQGRGGGERGSVVVGVGTGEWGRETPPLIEIYLNHCHCSLCLLQHGPVERGGVRGGRGGERGGVRGGRGGERGGEKGGVGGEMGGERGGVRGEMGGERGGEIKWESGDLGEVSSFPRYLNSPQQPRCH